MRLGLGCACLIAISLLNIPIVAISGSSSISSTNHVQATRSTGPELGFGSAGNSGLGLSANLRPNRSGGPINDFSTTSSSSTTSFLGTPICLASYGPQNCSTSPIWDAGFMDQGTSSIASDVSVLVAFPGMGSSTPSSIVQSGNYFAAGMVVESQTGSGASCSSCDYAEFSMVYLTNGGQPMIIGEVWKFDDAIPYTVNPPAYNLSLKFAYSWNCTCYTTSNWPDLVRLTMSWSGNTLSWFATVEGVQYALFRYSAETGQEPYFHIGTNSNNSCGGIYSCVDTWFQFGVMTKSAPNQNGWNNYVGAPQYIPYNSSGWTMVDKASWLGNQQPILDNWWIVGATEGFNKSDSCSTGGTFPVYHFPLVRYQMIIHPSSSQTSSYLLWDTGCLTGSSPALSFTSPTPAQGSWQSSDFEVGISSDSASAGYAFCWYSVDSWSGYNEISTLPMTQLPPYVAGGCGGAPGVPCCNTLTITVGSSGDCQFQKGDACKVSIWAEDFVGNFANPVTLYFTRDINSAFVLDWADADNDLTIDIVDIAMVAGCFGIASGSTGPQCTAAESSYWDLDRSGTVDISDVGTASGVFGQPAIFNGGGSLDTIAPMWRYDCNLLSSSLQPYCTFYWVNH